MNYVRGGGRFMMDILFFWNGLNGFLLVLQREFGEVVNAV
jgi:hypothetical protein